ncbi:hypothetical protein Gohar_010230, partial [Gossypium harknessii]|nr:hypothetical protein [Gossypium harknessii]
MIIWGGIRMGSFFVKSAYGKIRESSLKQKEDICSDLVLYFIWEWDIFEHRRIRRVVRNQNGEWITSLIGSWTDNLEVVTAIQESLTEGSNLGLIRRILQLLFQICHWNIYHIPREENQKADRLAKLAHLDSQGLCIFEISSFGDLRLL